MSTFSHKATFSTGNGFLDGMWTRHETITQGGKLRSLARKIAREGSRDGSYAEYSSAIGFNPYDSVHMVYKLAVEFLTPANRRVTLVVWSVRELDY
jgi:hypothetical protein